MDFLPAPDVRDWLLEQLAGLAARVGYQPLVCAPILLPTPTYFPDRWDADLESAHRLASRFHRYYGLQDVSPSLVLFEHERFSNLALGGTSERHEGAAAYFAGIEDGRALYGVDAAQLRDPAGIAAAMAHEAAHTFRARFDLVDPLDDIETEERLTDLTTVFLGAGVLTTAATERHDSHSEGLLGGHSWSVRRLGYLSPVEMAFALGVVLRVREASRGDVRRIGQALGLNQAKALTKAIAWLSDDAAEAGLETGLEARLGLPPRSQWEPPFDLHALTAPLGRDEEPLTLVDEPARPSADRGQPPHVFAVAPGYERTKFLGPGILAIVGLLAFTPVLGPIYAVAAAIALGWLGLLANRRFGARRCSDTDCGSVIARGSERCPGCRAKVAGEIKGYGARLDALEELEALGSGGES